MRQYNVVKGGEKMADQRNPSQFSEQQIVSAALLSGPMLDGIERASHMQNDGLQRIRTVMSETIDRQLDGCAATQQLIARLRATREPTEIHKAQLEWVAGAMQRFMSNMTWWQSTGVETLKELEAQAGEVKAPARTVAEVASPRSGRG
jgi:hypothetical protein